MTDELWRLFAISVSTGILAGVVLVVGLAVIAWIRIR